MTTPDSPLPIYVPNRTWDLGASPDELDATAGVLCSVGSGGSAAQETMDRAAFRVAAEGAWEGDTAEAYHQHRAKLSQDLAAFAEQASSPARALNEVAAVLRSGQRTLDGERERLRGIPGVSIGGLPGLFDGALIVFPRDEAEASTVRDALAAAEDARKRVDDELAARVTAFRTATAEYRDIEAAWQPRTVTHLNLNAGMGGGGGTTRTELDDLADAIASGEADVVTLQEVKHHLLNDDDEETQGLLSLLEERTGDRWTVAALSDPIDDYGNAVLVREGGAVEVVNAAEDPAADQNDDVALDPGTVFPGGPENREAAQAEVTIRD